MGLLDFQLLPTIIFDQTSVHQSVTICLHGLHGVHHISAGVGPKIEPILNLGEERNLSAPQRLKSENLGTGSGRLHRTRLASPMSSIMSMELLIG